MDKTLELLRNIEGKTIALNMFSDVEFSIDMHKVQEEFLDIVDKENIQNGEELSIVYNLMVTFVSGSLVSRMLAVIQTTLPNSKVTIYGNKQIVDKFQKQINECEDYSNIFTKLV